MTPRQPRGTRRIYVGASPGVGTTYAMLAEGRRRQARGTRVVVGAVDTAGRRQTAEQLEGLTVVPQAGRGVDVRAVLALEPQVVLVDDLGIEFRDVDIERLNEQGVDVVATLDMRHLERMRDVVFTLTGVLETETVPDEWVRASEQVELVDMTPEALRRRVAHGNVVPADRIEAALAKEFRLPTLTALRELSLLWVAGRVEDSLEEILRNSGVDDHRATKLLAYLRAAAEGEAPPLVMTKDFTLDFAVRRAERADGREVRLTPTEWHLVEALTCRRGRLVEQEDLLKEVWGPSYTRETNYLRVYLHQLRRKLEPDPAAPRYFLTEPGLGYRFEG